MLGCGKTLNALLRDRARAPRRSACAAFVLALSLIGCDRVLDFRDDYYVVAGSSSLSLGGAGNTTGASGGMPGEVGGAEGGKPSETGGDASGGSAESGSGGSAVASAGDGGGGASGGDLGVAGAPDVVRCADNPLSAETAWVPSASPVDDKYPPSAVIDGTSARWTTGIAQAGGEWLQIDFGQVVGIRRVNLQQGMTYSNDYPRGYQVVVSNTSENLKGPIAATGVGISGVTTTIVLPQVFVGRYLLIEQTSTSLSWWSVEEIEVSCYDS